MVAKNKNVPLERYELVASIQASTISYSISDHRPSLQRVDDEALLDVSSRIVAIGTKHATVGSPLKIGLICSNSYGGDGLLANNEAPMFSLTFQREYCTAQAYLPGEVFWGLRPLLYDGQLEIVKLTYGKPRYGSADLVTIAFE